MRKRIQFFVGEKLYNALREYAFKENTRISIIIRTALIEYLKKEGMRVEEKSEKEKKQKVVISKPKEKLLVIPR